MLKTILKALAMGSIAIAILVIVLMKPAVLTILLIATAIYLIVQTIRQWRAGLPGWGTLAGFIAVVLILIWAFK